MYLRNLLFERFNIEKLYIEKIYTEWCSIRYKLI